MKTFRRMLAVLLALVMSMSVIGTVAFAATAIDETATGTLTIHKFENDNKGPNGDGTEITDTSALGEALEGVTFTLYQVKSADDTIAYYNGTDATSVTVDDYLVEGAINTEMVIGEGKPGVTDDKGEVTFEKLPVGMYVVIETAAPDKVTQKADPFLVSIPMTNPSDENEWMYDVHVYPKNSTSVGSVTVKKFGEDGSTALNGVKFKLQKQNGTDWEEVIINEATEWTITNGEIAFTERAHGTYRLIETGLGGNEGYIMDTRPIEFTINQDSTVSCTEDLATVSLEGNGSAALTIKITNEKPDVTKTATNNKDVAGVGDTVSYALTVEVPENITAMKTYTVKDAPAGLNVDNSTIMVKLGNAEVTGFYTAPATGDEDTTDGFTLTFTPSAMGDYAGETLTITYDAIVLASAATNNTATNTATLTYSDVLVPDEDYDPDDPDDPGNSTDEDEDDEETKNFKISIVKYKDSVADANKAADVEFELYSDAAMSQKVGVTGTAGDYVVSKDAGAITTLVTGSEGELVVSGLAAGTYYLKETKAPDGYNLLSDEIEITLNTTAEEDLTYEQNIINKAGFNLPQTGGLGTLMFIIIGAVLIGGGVCLLKPKKRAV